MDSHLIGTSSKCLHFGGSTIDLQGYVDSDLGGDLDTNRLLQDMYLLLVGQQ